MFTDLVATEITSHKQLPLYLYQIGIKYRDEIRPRFGLMRAREFVMKDLYSFDLTKEDAIKSYWIMYEAYNKLFKTLEVPFAPAEADTGNIGGNLSHEFHILSDVGEDTLLYCQSCSYFSNIEKAKRKLPSISNIETQNQTKLNFENLHKKLEIYFSNLAMKKETSYVLTLFLFFL